MVLNRTEVIAVGLALIAVMACDGTMVDGTAAAGGGDTNIAPPESQHTGGSINAGGSSGAPGVAAKGGSGGDSGNGGDSGSGGDGAAPCSPAACLAASGLSPADVVVDADELVGKSFTLTEGTLCTDYWSDTSFYPQLSLLTVHVRRSATGELEAVASTGAIGEDYEGDRGVLGTPHVDVVPMKQTGLGWNLEGLVTCSVLAYGFEYSFHTDRYVAESAHVVFERDLGSNEPVAVRVAASTYACDEDETCHDHGPPALMRGVPDTTPPEWAVLRLGGTYDIDGIPNEGFAKTYFFSEPIGEASVSVRDEAGHRLDAVLLEEDGYVVGFEVDDVLSSDLELHVAANDLAANVVQLVEPYAGISLEPASDFESSMARGTDWRDTDSWGDGSSPSQCDHVGARTTTAGAFYEFDLDVQALAGEQSFLLGPGVYADCYVTYLRVQRPPGATELAFEARTISAPVSWPEGLAVKIWSLQPGDEGVGYQDPRTWTIDPEHQQADVAASSIETFSFALPPEGDDFLLEVRPSSYLWMDSLRTE